MSTERDFFQVGGTLGEDSPSYIERPADEELLRALERGELCLVLAPRQTGKSSLMVHAKARLRTLGIRAGSVDFQPLGIHRDPEAWFRDTVYQIERSLGLQADAGAWWDAHRRLGPTQRFMTFLEDVVLGEIEGRVVLFFDEIDSVLPLPFSDDFFTTLRALFNARADNPTLRRLSVVLLGKATPSEFIQNRSRTPFNIGREIELRDFEPTALSPFKKVLGPDSEPLVDRIFYWTGGQPLMVQKLAEAVYSRPAADRTPEQVDEAIQGAYIDNKIERDTHLKFIRDYLLEGNPKLRKTLKTYQAVLEGQEVPYSHPSPIHSRLKLAGVVRVEEQKLVPRNRIYQRVFDSNWVKENTPRDITKAVAYGASSALVLVLLGFFLVQPLFWENIPWDLTKAVAYGASSALVLVLLWFFLVRPLYFPKFSRFQTSPWQSHDLYFYYTEASAIRLTVPLPPDAEIVRITLDGQEIPWKGPEKDRKTTGLSVSLEDLPVGASNHRLRFYGGLWKENFETRLMVSSYPMAHWKPLTDLAMIEVAGGCFDMGCGEWDGECEGDEKPLHRVCLGPFQIGKYEVTQDQWERIMGYNPSRFQKGGAYPVENVSWDDVQEFIRRLNRQTGESFRLPTEAEWEFAARSGGKPQKYAGGSDLNRLAWYEGNSGGATHPVGKKDPNGLGLHDMSGNVWEWCWDWYDGGYYQVSPVDNPKGPETGALRAVRGGGWYDDARGCRSAGRGRLSPGGRGGDLGFRLSRSVALGPGALGPSARPSETARRGGRGAKSRRSEAGGG